MFSQRTTTALLGGLLEAGNSWAWVEFDGRCRPIMHGVARRMGLSQAQAEDAVQSALTTFAQAYTAGQYDRSRGRLSAYILTLLRSRAIDLVRREHRHREAVALEDVHEAVVAMDTIERFWFDERQAQILRLALEKLREEGTDERMLEAFELYGLRAVAIAEVCARLSMTRDEVYNAKYRIIRRLQPIVAKLDELYEDL